MQAGKYPTWDALRADLTQMLNNAMLFNEDGSQIFLDAKKLLVTKARARNCHDLLQS